MAFTPQNFKDFQSVPPVTAAWLNGIDITVNGVLAGATTVGAAQTALGYTTLAAVEATITASYIGLAIYPENAAETSAGVTVVNPQYPYGNLLRYGIVPNNAGAAANNATILMALVNNAYPNGPTGLIYSPNTGAASTPDNYYFAFTNNAANLRPGITLDLNGTTWTFSGTFSSSYSGYGFLTLASAYNVTIQNGTIVSNATGAGAAYAIQLGWRDGNSGLPAQFDAYTPAYIANGQTLGNIKIQNLNILFNGSGGTAQCGIQALGGLQGVTLENLWIDGGSSAYSQYGVYYEFGFATNQTSRYQRQTSHAHNWTVRNAKFTNFGNANSVGFQSNGGYNLSFENVTGSNVASVLAFSCGDSMFLDPWIGQDDLGSLPQMPQNGTNLTGTSGAGRNIWIKNVTGRLLTGVGVNMVGASQNVSGWASTLQAWLPGATYGLGALVYNGAFKWKLTTLGSGVSVSSTPFVGPTATNPTVNVTTSADANGLVWTYEGAAYGTGFRGWNLYQYAVGDVVINGQYAYVCTQANTSTIGPATGPLGIGTNITDNLGGLWSSIPSSGASTTLYPGTGYQNAWNISGQLNLTLDGFDIDGNALAYGVESSAPITTIRNGKLTNCSRGIVTTLDALNLDIDGVTILDSNSSFGMQIGLQNSVWTPYRLTSGTIRNCTVAGTSVAGAAGGIGIALAQVSNIIIENNVLGYEFARHGITEQTQSYGVYCPSQTYGNNSKGIIARNNYATLPTAVQGTGQAYVVYTGTPNCVLDNNVGNDVSYTGPWEGVPQHATTLTLTAATEGNLSAVLSTARIDYIKRGNRVDYSIEIVTSTWTYSSATGQLTINGLPFAVNSLLGSISVGALAVNGLTKAGYTNFVLAPIVGTTTLVMYASGSGEPNAVVAVTDFPSGGTVEMWGSGFYFVTNGA